MLYLNCFTYNQSVFEMGRRSCVMVVMKCRVLGAVRDVFNEMGEDGRLHYSATVT